MCHHTTGILEHNHFFFLLNGEKILFSIKVLCKLMYNGLFLIPTRKIFLSTCNIHVHLVILTCDLFISMLLHLQVSSNPFFTWLHVNQSSTLLPQNSKMHGGRDQTKGVKNFCGVFFVK